MKRLLLLFCVLLLSTPVFSFDREIMYDSIDALIQFKKLPRTATAALQTEMDMSDGKVYEKGELVKDSEEGVQRFSIYPYLYRTIRDDNGGLSLFKARSATSPTSSSWKRELSYDQDGTLQTFTYNYSRSRPYMKCKKEYGLLYVDNALRQATCYSYDEQYKIEPVWDTTIYSIVHDTIDDIVQSMVKSDNKNVFVTMQWDSVKAEDSSDTTRYVIKHNAVWDDSLDIWQFDSVHSVTYEYSQYYARTIYRDYIYSTSGKLRNRVNIYYWNDTLQYVQSLQYDSEGEVKSSSKLSFVHGEETALLAENVYQIGTVTSTLENDKLVVRGLKENEQIAIVNAQGRILLQGRAGINGILRLSMQNISSGVHFIVTNNKRIKFIK